MVQQAPITGRSHFSSISVPPYPHSQFNAAFPHSPAAEDGKHTERAVTAATAITPLPVPLALALPPILWPSPVTVEKVGDWRAYKKGERDAGLTGSTPTRITTPSFFCAVCDIAIGKDFYETELYYWPLYKQSACMADDKTYYFLLNYALICGSCAHHRDLPHRYLLVPATAWDICAIVTPDQVVPLARQVQALFFLRVLGRYYPTLLMHLLLLSPSHSVSRPAARALPKRVPGAQAARKEKQEEESKGQERRREIYALPPAPTAKQGMAASFLPPHAQAALSFPLLAPLAL